MEKQILNGNWNLKIKGKDSGLIPEKGIPVQIPGSVYSAFLREAIFLIPITEIMSCRFCR